MTESRRMNGLNRQNNTKNRKSLFVDITYHRGIVKAFVVGPRIGEREATIVANAINAKLKEYGKKVNSLVLDFSNVQFVSSLGLGMCIDVRNTAEQCQASTTISGLASYLQELFVMMRLDRLFVIEQEDVQYDSAA